MKLRKFLFGIGLILLLVTASVNAESNVNTGGGGTGGGTSSTTNVYSGGDFGIRFTIVDADSGIRTEGTRTIDYFKKNNKTGKDIYHFGGDNKLEYLKGKTLVGIKNGYNAGSNAYAFYQSNLWNVIDSTPYGKKASLTQIKSWLDDSSYLNKIAERTGITYEMLKDGDYKMIVEPIFYVTYKGNYYAMSAHEVAKFDEAVGGDIRKHFVTYSHKNIPLSLFLKKKTFGIKAWTGSKTARVSNNKIKSYLGVAVMSWDKEEPETEIETEDYVYRRNTDVITAVNVTATEEANPDNPITVFFEIPNVGIKKVTGVIMPDGYKQRAWVKWRTPDTPQTVVIKVSTSSGSAKSQITCRISKLDTLEPMNPTADDIKPTDFNLSADPTVTTPSKINTIESYQWTRWERCVWERELMGYKTITYRSGTDAAGNATYSSYEEPIYEYYWHFGTGTGRTPGEPTHYSASIRNINKLTITPAETARKANTNNNTIKSGYGISAELSTQLVTNQSAAVIPFQTAVFYFPEFNYKGCWRIGEVKSKNTLDSMIVLPENLYSIHHTRAHFTPIWFPDTSYKVYVKFYDAWTPMGQLKGYTTADIEIKGSLWDDWHIGLVRNLTK